MTGMAIEEAMNEFFLVALDQVLAILIAARGVGKLAFSHQMTSRSADFAVVRQAL
jgi:hypothetical protein